MPDGHLFSAYDMNRCIGDFLTNDVKGEQIGYKLRPYFGGNQTAPHDIIIKMDEL